MLYTIYISAHYSRIENMHLLHDASYQWYIAVAQSIEMVHPPHPQSNLLIFPVGWACMDYVAKQS